MGHDRDREETFDCAACGAEVFAKAKTCRNCGRRLGDPIESEEPFTLMPEQRRRRVYEEEKALLKVQQLRA